MLSFIRHTSWQIAASIVLPSMITTLSNDFSMSVQCIHSKSLLLGRNCACIFPLTVCWLIKSMQGYCSSPCGGFMKVESTLRTFFFGSLRKDAQVSSLSSLRRGSPIFGYERGACSSLPSWWMILWSSRISLFEGCFLRHSLSNKGCRMRISHCCLTIWSRSSFSIMRHTPTIIKRIEWRER